MGEKRGAVTVTAPQSTAHGPPGEVGRAASHREGGSVAMGACWVHVIGE